MVDIKAPALGESVAEATIAKWYKQPGDAVEKDELLVELETDKVTLEVNAPESGALSEVKANEGDSVEEGDLLGVIEAGASGNASAAPAEEKKEAPKEAAPAAAPASSGSGNADGAGPAARKALAESGLDAKDVQGTGKDGRITKGDVQAAVSGGGTGGVSAAPEGPREERVKMTKLRQTIAKRLKESQNTAAILTTFNEVDMTNVMQLRKEHQDAFVDKYGVKLGFMSLFTKASVLALQELPAVNAEIDGDELVYKNYYNIGVAVGTEQGLVVPVVRDADRMNFAEIEKDIARMAKAARDGKLAMSELQGGSFTITNGGIYGSMLSTPIINPPQSGILGLHNITQRAVVMPDGSIQARPMMYIALSYDHRIIDGREAVTFLKRVKEMMENPASMLFGV